jgi:hypothetical protein
MLHKLFISYDFSPMDVSSANNLHKPIVSSAMSLINNKKRRGHKQVAVLRKLKFKVSRNFFETMYLTCIRPLLEYTGEVWDKCTLADSEPLEKIQLEAARIATAHRLMLIYFYL